MSMEIAQALYNQNVWVGLHDIHLPSVWHLNVRRVPVPLVPRCGRERRTSGLSFHRISARTRPSPWTRSGWIALPTSPSRGADRDSSAMRSMTMPWRFTRHNGPVGTVATGGRGGRRGGDPAVEEYHSSDMSEEEAIQRAMQESELLELGLLEGLSAQLQASVATSGPSGGRAAPPPRLLHHLRPSLKQAGSTPSGSRAACACHSGDLGPWCHAQP
jgi:hypothetical protein